jgi:hypothetical protein
MSQLGGLIGKFKKYRGLGVGVCDAPAPASLGRIHHFPGCAAGPQYRAFAIGGHLSNVGILAKAASKVAADGGNGIRKCSGKEMKQRFFFNGINVPGYEPTVYQGFKNAGLVCAHIAYPSAAVFDCTTMAAKVAPYIISLKSFIKVCFHVFALQLESKIV